MERDHFEDLYCQEIIQQWLDHAVRMGDIVIPNYQDVREQIFERIRWVGPEMGQINEKVSIDAAAARIEAGLSTREIETLKMGNGDYYEIAAKLKKEQEALGNGISQAVGNEAGSD